MWWSIIHGQLDRRTDATKFTASKLAAVVAYELPWDAIREHGSFEHFNHLRDRLAPIQPAGDDRAGMVVQDGILCTGLNETLCPPDAPGVFVGECSGGPSHAEVRDADQKHLPRGRQQRMAVWAVSAS